jgi:ketosteroid isomerase-like protein
METKNENAKLIESLYAAFGRGDMRFILDHFAADIELNGPDAPELPYRGAYHGREGAQQYFERLLGALEITAFEPKNYVASGDDVMTTGLQSGKTRATGKSFRTPWAMHFVVKNGQVAYARVYEDSGVTAAALRA